MLAARAATGKPRIVGTAEENFRVPDREGALALSQGREIVARLSVWPVRAVTPPPAGTDCTPRGAAEERRGDGCRAAPSRYNRSL